MSRLAELHPRRFFLETWRALDDERSPPSEAARDFEPAIALAVAALSLTMMEYWGGLVGMRGLFALWEGDLPPELGIEAGLKSSGLWDLAKLGYWCGCRVLGYFAIPALVLGARGQRIRDQHLATTGLRDHAFIYVLAYAVVFVCVVAVSFTPEFSSYYPFYELAHRSWADFFAWEAMYAAHFFAIEFFFRGYLLNSCRKSLGSAAIFVSAVPYVMVHFGKPMAETFGALAAGIVLGTLAMKTRSIWLGFAIHVSIALSMDVAALLQTRGLPTTWMPPY